MQVHLFELDCLPEGRLGTRRGTYRIVPTLRKLFKLIGLVSFSSHNRLLAGWTEDLRERVVRPLFEQLKRGEREKCDALPLMHLELTLALAGNISHVDQPAGRGPQPVLAEVECYARFCYHYGEQGCPIFNPFEWLATYLSRHRGVLGVSASELFDSVAASVEDGMAFHLAALASESPRGH